MRIKRTKILLLLLSAWMGSMELCAQDNRTIEGEVMNLKGRMVPIHVPKNHQTSPLESDSTEEENRGPLIMPYQVAPIDTLIQRAWIRSPLLQSQDALIETKVITRKNEAWDWTDMGRVFGGASYGNGQILNNATDGSGTVNTLATRQDLFYSVGLNLTLSPYDLLTRKRRLQGLETEIVRARMDRVVMEEQIAEAVMRRYHDLKLSIDLEGIRQQNLRNQQINTELAEGYFLAGDLSYPEYNMAMESLIKAKIDYTSAKSMTERTYLLLQYIVGDELY